MVHTDGWRGYAGLAAAGYQHQVTVLSGGSDPAHEVMPRVHLVASLLKRWLIGTHQGGVSINISTTTSTNSPSASIAADQRPAGCSFIASPNKPSPLDPRPTTPSSSHRVPATPGQRGNEGDTQFVPKALADDDAAGLPRRGPDVQADLAAHIAEAHDVALAQSELHHVPGMHERAWAALASERGRSLVEARIEEVARGRGRELEGMVRVGPFVDRPMVGQ